MPDARTILLDTKVLKLLHVHASGESITLAARTTSAEVRCPVCGTLSRRVHSRYVRMLADLPWQGIPVNVRLHVRRFFCDERSCERAIFAELLPGVVTHYARRTERLDKLFTHVSFALGGEAGARLLDELGVVISADTLLEHIRRTSLGESRTPRILSVDDFPSGWSQVGHRIGRSRTSQAGGRSAGPPRGHLRQVAFGASVSRGSQPRPQR